MIVQLLWVYLKRTRNNCSEFCKYWVLESNHDWTTATTYTTNEGKKSSSSFLVQFSRSVFSNFCDPVDHSTPGFPVHHQLPELAQTHVHRVGDAIQPSHPLSSPSPPAFNLSQHQVFPRSHFFSSGGQNIGVSALASVLPMNIQDWYPLGSTGLISLQSMGPSRVFSNAMVQNHWLFGAQ